MNFIKTYEDWSFGKADNVDLPAIEVEKNERNPFRPSKNAESTLIFSPDEEGEYPYKMGGKTHGIESHAIKHLYDFKPELFRKYIEDSRDILMPYVDEQMQIVDKDGYIEDQITEYEDIEEMNPYKIINALDFINDKVYNKEELLEVEEKLLELVIDPITDEYKRLIDWTVRNAVGIRDYRKEMGNKPVFFNVSRKNGFEATNFYDPNIKGIVATSLDKNRVYTLFKITSRNVYDYFNSQKAGTTKPMPNNEIKGFLRNYGK